MTTPQNESDLEKRAREDRRCFVRRKSEFTVVLTPGADGWFVAEVPSMPGCISQGRTQSDALRNIADAIDSIRAVQARLAAPEEEERP
jgi:predicted RNase H-like HicB family nuclease